MGSLCRILSLRKSVSVFFSVCRESFHPGLHVSQKVGGTDEGKDRRNSLFVQLHKNPFGFLRLLPISLFPKSRIGLGFGPRGDGFRIFAPPSGFLTGRGRMFQCREKSRWGEGFRPNPACGGRDPNISPDGSGADFPDCCFALRIFLQVADKRQG